MLPVLRSHYSFCTGAIPLDDVLMERLRGAGHGYAVLADRNGLYGVVRFYKLCREYALTPVIGVSLEWEGRRKLLLAEGYAGYQNLCRLVTRRQLQEQFDFDAAWAECAEHVVDLEHAGVAWREVFYLDPADADLHRTLVAIREGGMRQQVDPALLARDAALLAAGILNTRERDLLDRCALTLPLGKPIFPKTPLPAGHAPADWLRRQCLDGLPRRYKEKDRPVALDRMNHELALIERLGFTEYFIITGDIVRHARERGIPCCGRGSGASSIVAYLLGITNVCPLRYNLLFERFLHEERADLPDLDIDFCWRGRDEVIEYVYDTYGRDRVAMISTVNTFQNRSAFREAAKAYGLSHDHVNRLGARLPRNIDLNEAARTAPARDLIPDQEPFPGILRDAARIVDWPRHLGVHPGGIVIGDKSIDHYVPLEYAAKGIAVTQLDMYSIEDVGLVKLDLLGNRALSEIREAVTLIHQRRGVDVDIERISMHEPRTAALVRSAETIGVFQIESPCMRGMLRQLKPSNVNELVTALAIVRPGAADLQMKRHFADVVNGRAKKYSLNPRLDAVLERNLGVVLYDEDVTRVLHEITGEPLSSCEVMRKALYKEADLDPPAPESGRTAWRPPTQEVDAQYSRRFLARAVQNGFSQEEAHDLLLRMRMFRTYMFSQAHAAGYGWLAWQSAWLKAHYPAEFACALGNHHAGMYPVCAIVNAMRRAGVRYLHPCIHHAGIPYTMEKESVRIGLGQIHGLSAVAARSILARRPFSSLTDLLARVRLSYEEGRSLILSGACDDFGRNRPTMIFELKLRHGRLPRPADIAGANGALFETGHEAIDVPALPDFDDWRKMAYEVEAMGLSLHRHACEILRPQLESLRLETCRAAGECANRRVAVLGAQIAQRTLVTDKREKMAFVTLEDETGVLECTLFPDTYRRHARHLQHYGPYIFTGHLQEENDQITLTVDTLTPSPNTA